MEYSENGLSTEIQITTKNHIVIEGRIMPVKRATRLGILTGGGDCPGLNAVIRAVTKTAVIEYQWEVVGFEDGFNGLFEPTKVRRLGLASVRGILPKGGTILGTASRGNPFAREVIQDGKKTIYDASKDAIKRIAELGIDVLIVLGGDGTLRAAYELAEMGAPIIGVPKTIDNDIPATDITFGFDTAVATATDAVDKLHTTAESHHRAMVVEVMGRNAGWIALHTGLAGGADAILIPEIPFDIRKICAMIRDRERHNVKFSIIVVSEGAKPVGGEQFFQSKGDILHQARLGGIGNYVADQIMTVCGQEARTVVLGHLQRGGSPTSFDRLLSTRYGAAAVHAFAEGKLGTMVALRGNDIITVPLAELSQENKTVPVTGGLVHIAKGLGVTFGD